MTITNGTFDTNLNGWTVNDPNRVVWEDGHVLFINPDYSSPVYMNQTFIVEKGVISFDWVVLSACSCRSKSWNIYIDNVIVQSNSFGPTWGCLGAVSGREKINVLKHIGKTIKFEITTDASPCYGFNMQVDNVSSEDIMGITNGRFDQGFNGWEVTGDVILDSCSGFSCSGNIAGIGNGGILRQYFVIDKCSLKFAWRTNGPGDQGYNLYIDNILSASKVLPGYSTGIELIDVSGYIGHIAIISFYCNAYYLRIDNVETVTDPFSASVVSYPPGANIYINGNDTGYVTTNAPTIVVAGLTEGQNVVTLKLAGYTDYVETANIIRCQANYIIATFESCVTFIATPSGANICIDNIDTGHITPYTFCGYSVGSSHTYSLYLKNYRVDTGTITFSSGRGILIDKILVYETGGVQFNIVPNGAKIIVDGVDTGKVTPDIINNIPIGYHNYEIILNGYYSLTGSFRSVVGIIKQLSGTLQQVTGITNGTFDSDLSGWTVISPNPTEGYVEWTNGKAHLVTNNIPISISQDFIATEDSIVFNYDRATILNKYCDIGWYVVVNPDTPEQATISSYCGIGSSSEYWGYFEIDTSAYKGKIIRIVFYLNGMKIVYIGGPAEAYLYNVGNVKPIRSVTFDALCIRQIMCPTDSPTAQKCYADLYFDGNYIGIDQITIDKISIGTHNYLVRNQNYTSIDTNSQDVTGNISFPQGIFTHTYIDNIYLPGLQEPGEGCVRFESIPSGLHIYVDGIDTGKVTPDTVCNLSLDIHNYELKLLHSSYKGTFILGPGFGEYVSVEIYETIQFGSIPSGAEIILDGIDLGVQTPYVTGPIPIGLHTYTLRLANFQEFICQIEVIKGQTSIINPELISQEGCIYIDSCPIGVNVSVDGIGSGITPLSVCGLTGHHEYTLSLIGYEDYTEAFDMPVGKGINKRISLVRKIGVPFTDPTKIICSPGISLYDNLPPYSYNPAYIGKNGFSMRHGSITTIDAQGYDLIHLYVIYHNYWVGFAESIGGTLYIYQSDTPGDCITIPTGAELISTLSSARRSSTGADSQVLLTGVLNISKRYIIMQASVYICNISECWEDGNSSIWVMEAIPPTCILPEITTCEKPQLYTTVSANPSQITSGDTSQIAIHVTDDIGTPIEGATVNLLIPSGTLDLTSGITNTNGDFTSIYTASMVIDIQTFTIIATASKSGYTDGSGSVQIIVRAPANWQCEQPLNGYENDGYGNRRLNPVCNPVCQPNWQCEIPLNGYEIDGCSNRRLNPACNPVCQPNWQCEIPLNGYEIDGCSNRRLNPICLTSICPTHSLLWAFLIGLGSAYALFHKEKDKRIRKG